MNMHFLLTDKRCFFLGSETHFKVVVVSDDFLNKTLIQVGYNFVLNFKLVPTADL